MKSSIPFVLGFATLALLTLERPARANTSLTRDAEDSPLYAASMRNSLADMTARDRGSPIPSQVSPDAVLGLDAVIVVEGGKWHALPGGAKDPRPKPLGVTTEVTCTGNPTCGMVITCQIIGRTCQGYPTCGGNETCTWTVTCNNTCTFYPTCSGSGQPTCWGPTCLSPTCAGATCDAQVTCSGYYTCNGAITCAFTCLITCSVGNCPPPVITGVNVPQPGQFQFSFVARGANVTNVSYNVQFCTNLDAAQWSTIYSIPANNSSVTFTHTNNAPRAYYRVSIQNL